MSLENVLTELREDLAGRIGSVTVTDADGVTPIPVPIELVVPNPITPPCIITGPDDPYIDFNDIEFGEKRVNLLVILAAPAGTNEVSAAQVDEMLVAALPKLLAADPVFVIDTVGQPGRISVEGQICLGAVIRLHTFSALA